ncbi:ClpXP protease specificity-enhancing factor SspB [Sandaracinus amylolyticus]|uniref:Stringent starvation protein B n=1 Tax=Sandaracinus amylolyticus TaxID=927083 RepID=A0A0F6SH30_9BACT|nr:ClpXP protease specificity-enhancing factor SspB [Sandaracinus amylolyticus]AKF09729.1 hypothetical protein DB32_006878 [Sandaracinus amylolyticus]
MRRAEIHHPIHAAIDDIWNAGHTPRIQVDARRDDVVVPEFVKTKWGARLVLDLDASWPLNLTASEQGLEVDLAFQGQVTRCTLPWASIYVVLDRATGRGIVIESHLPKDETLQTHPERPALREGVESSEASVEAPAPVPAPASSGEKPESSDEEAKRRRARFKVIDGGR